MSIDWEARYREGDTPWDRGAAAPPLLEWLEHPSHRFNGEVLVPGCGLGHDVRAIAATKQARQVYGIDLSPTAMSNARATPAAGNEAYIDADLFALPQEFCGRFEWAFEHTCFCAIDPSQRPAYVQAVAGALRPGGHLLAIFYLRPWARGEARPPGGGPPYAAEVDELDALFASEFHLIEDTIPKRTYPGREGRELVRLLQRKTAA